jgi:Leucine-rich repeat (LRR) protein
MKFHKLFFYFFTFTFTTIYSQFTTIPDAKFEEKLINIGLDDVIDGKVLTNNIDVIEDLDISSSQISDLTGIEGFTNLINLDCSNNELIILDISNNIFIKNLICSNNNITNLDISYNTELQYISIEHNELTSLDTSKNKFIKGLFCSYNKITNLHVKNNKSLQYLSTSFNQLVSLDMSDNNYLKSLLCNDNSLKSLNLNNNNNEFLDIFNSENNADLMCIQVDNKDFSNSSIYWIKDATASYSTFCTTASSTSESLLKNISFFIFSDKKVKITSKLEGNFKIYTINSQEILTGNFTENATILNLNRFANGLYILQFIYKNVRTSKKFLLY